MKFFHKSALLQEVTKNLSIQKGEKYIDATLGGGGHTREILSRGGIVLGIDQDREAIEYVEENLESRIKNSELKLARGNFRDIKGIAEENNFTNASGILFDLGVSSYQLDDSGRGFSFKRDELLDMRMDKNSSLTAFDVVNKYSKEELSEIFLRYGEEENAEEVAEEIVAKRKIKKIETTQELVDLILRVHPPARQASQLAGVAGRATKIFQAIRIEVNNELESIKSGIMGSFDLLNPEGRILVISFHSLEDRIVKRIFDDWRKKSFGGVTTRKPIIANYDEVRSNPRARSAKLRVFEKK